MYRWKNIRRSVEIMLKVYNILGIRFTDRSTGILIDAVIDRYVERYTNRDKDRQRGR